ncbi:hypothetical protein VZT92_006990 [Zoarces viviparus]|uniref:Uncharacterized protein n=1 Tax=Zoarces viviparus TaxID=48416 RepID=A0AAW1FJK1_ZOAVI
MSLSPGSTIGHPRPPQWARPVTGLHSVWGVGGVSHGGTVRRYKSRALPGAPLSTPRQRFNDSRTSSRKMAQEVADFAHLPDAEPEPLCRSAPTDKLSDQQ